VALDQGASKLLGSVWPGVRMRPDGVKSTRVCALAKTAETDHTESRADRQASLESSGTLAVWAVPPSAGSRARLRSASITYLPH